MTTRLILTIDSSAAGAIKMAGLAEIAIALERQLVWGRAPSDLETAAFFAARTKRRNGLHWQHATPKWRLEKHGGKDLGLIEFCARYDSVELWIDPEPNGQLTLLWLLDYLRAYQNVVAKLSLVQANVTIAEKSPEVLADQMPTAVAITCDHLEIAARAWQAYRAPTPERWFDLRMTDLSLLPHLRPAVLTLLEELPWRGTGLGATERRMLQVVEEGAARPEDVFPKHGNERRVFNYWEIGALLDGLAHCPAPAVSGLREGPFTMEMHDDHARYQRYRKSQLSLTPLGEAILAGRDDFSRNNPVHRWWGGTELTNDHLWRWDPARGALIAP